MSVPKANKSHNPLVSIIVYNYNYGRYLRQCLQSAVDQTYQNIEILFSDNDSEDDSWEIALEFANKYPGKISIAKNRRNVGAYKNSIVWSSQLNSDFWMHLCSDDYLEIDCVEKAMRAAQQSPDAAFVMFHRNIINDDGLITTEAPFFNKSCIIDPPGLNMVYMKSSITPSISQIIYRQQSVQGAPRGSYGLFRSFFGTRITDFLACLKSPIIYINEPLLNNRSHPNNHGKFAEEYLIEIVGAYGLGFEFLEYVSEKLPEALDEFNQELPACIYKHANTSVRYALRFLEKEEYKLCKKYIFLALSLHPELEDDPLTADIIELCKIKDRHRVKAFFDSNSSAKQLIKRTISYDPPIQHREINIDL